MGYINQLLSQTKDLWIEAFGTFLLVLVSTSALVTLNLSGQATTAAVMLVGILAYAFTYGWLIFAFDGRQKGFFNPAVTLLRWLGGQVTLSWMAAAMLVQLAGGLLASIMVALLFGPTAVDVGLGAIHPLTSMGPVAAMVAEGLGTLFVLMAIIKSPSTDSPAKRGLLVGCSIATGQLLTIGISGAGLNPVRALAPQLVAADAGNWWVYLVGPMVAAMAVWLGNNWLHRPSPVYSFPETPLSPPAKSQPVTLPLDEEDSPEVLQRKAEQALAALRQTDSTTISQSDQSTASEPAPLQPSFNPDDEDQPLAVSTPPIQPMATNSPQPVARKPLSKPTTVKFVDFDQPQAPLEPDEE